MTAPDRIHRSALEPTNGEYSAMSKTSTLTPEKIMQLGLGFWGSKTLLSAIEVGLFTALADGPLNAKGLAERLGLLPRRARAFFDAMCPRHAPRESVCTVSRDDLFLSRQAFLFRRGAGDGNERLYPLGC